MRQIPNDFPKFSANGYPLAQSDMDSLRQLLWNHSLPTGDKWTKWLNGPDGFPDYPQLPSGPKATLWDEWLCDAQLWPKVETDRYTEEMTARWHDTLLARQIDETGYVETDQGTFYTHNAGWPFPLWSGGGKSFGWHFTFAGQAGALDTPNGKTYRPPHTCTQDGWTLAGAADGGMDAACGWRIRPQSPFVTIESPPQTIDTFEAPFIQIRWKSHGIGKNQPYLEWAAAGEPFSSEKRMYFQAVIEGADLVYVMVPVYQHPLWKGEINQIRICVNNDAAPAEDAEIGLIAVFANYDTRHNINNLNYIRGCIQYFCRTHDLDFLRRVIGKIRTALRSFMFEHHTKEESVVHTTWVGHDGISSAIYLSGGKYETKPGHGVPNNYWDILPFGCYDGYATLHYYDVLCKMGELEKAIASHPEWNIPYAYDKFDAQQLALHAAEVKEKGNKLLWNPLTNRFAANVDCDGEMHDYGYVYVNVESIYYGFATDEHAASIMSWLNGDRMVEGDTSQGSDIYKNRFGPRTSTKRNVEYWFWGWNIADSIPFGQQIQDGGAVMGFSYHDIMARLKTLGPDNAYQKLQAAAEWYRDVQKAGGYTEYYAQIGENLQGANVAGGIGITNEFFESMLLPQVLLRGFAGFCPSFDEWVIAPALPDCLDSLRIDNISIWNLSAEIEVKKNTIHLTVKGCTRHPITLHIPGKWALDNREAAMDCTVSHRDGATFVSGLLVCGNEQSIELNRC